MNEKIKEYKFQPGDRVTLKQTSGFANQSQGNAGTVQQDPKDWGSEIWYKVNWDNGDVGHGYPEGDLVLMKKQKQKIFKINDWVKLLSDVCLLNQDNDSEMLCFSKGSIFRVINLTQDHLELDSITTKLYKTYFVLASGNEVVSHLLNKAKEKGLIPGVTYYYPDRLDLEPRTIKKDTEIIVRLPESEDLSDLGDLYLSTEQHLIMQFKNNKEVWAEPLTNRFKVGTRVKQKPTSDFYFQSKELIGTTTEEPFKGSTINDDDNWVKVRWDNNPYVTRLDVYPITELEVIIDEPKTIHLASAISKRKVSSSWYDPELGRKWEDREQTFTPGDWVRCISECKGYEEPSKEFSPRDIYRIKSLSGDPRAMYLTEGVGWSVPMNHFILAIQSEIESHLLNKAKQLGFIPGAVYTYPNKPNIPERVLSDQALTVKKAFNPCEFSDIVKFCILDKCHLIMKIVDNKEIWARVKSTEETIKADFAKQIADEEDKRFLEMVCESTPTDIKNLPVKYLTDNSYIVNLNTLESERLDDIPVIVISSPFMCEIPGLFNSHFTHEFVIAMNTITNVPYRVLNRFKK